MVAARQVDGRVLDTAGLLQVQLARVRRVDAPAPAEPQAAAVGARAVVERGLQRHREAAGARLPGQRDAVGNDHQPAHARLAPRRATAGLATSRRWSGRRARWSAGSWT